MQELDFSWLTEENACARETFEKIYDIEDVFEREQAKQATKALAKSKTEWTKLDQTFYASYIKKTRAKNEEYYPQAFENAPLQLSSSWKCDMLGIRREGSEGVETACPHPILITERLKNVETGREKCVISYHRDGGWHNVVADKQTVSSRQSIVSLSDYGILVTSENARFLVSYLNNLESYNTTEIPFSRSADRFGWINEKQFVPYVDGIRFDGQTEQKYLFECVGEKGIFGAWAAVAVDACQQNDTINFLLSASLGSVLLPIINKLPFLVHLWGRTGGGKTVAMMLCASVWGDPEQGKLTRSMNATKVGLERLAAMMNHIPLFLNELQTVRDRSGDSMIYALCEGTGRERGQKHGGNDRMLTWRNCILTNGEQPIVGDNFADGASNRILEIETKEDLFEDAPYIADFVRDNYGGAGRRFVEYITTLEDAKIKDDYQELFLAVKGRGATEKQAASASVVLLANKYAVELFGFPRLDFDSVAALCKKDSDIDIGQRVVDNFVGWVVENLPKFDKTGDRNGVQWGKIENGHLYILTSVLNEWLSKQGIHKSLFYNACSGYFLNGIEKNYTKSFQNQNSKCVWVKNWNCRTDNKLGKTELEEPENMLGEIF